MARVQGRGWLAGAAALPVSLGAAAAGATEPPADTPYNLRGRQPRRVVEAGALAGPTLDNNGVPAMSTNVMLRYFVDDALAIGVEGSLMTAIAPRSELERWESDRLGFGGQFLYNTLYAPLGDEPFPAVELYLYGALGMITSKPSPLSTTQGPSVALSTLVGGAAGMRFSFAHWVTMLLELRDDAYLGTEIRNVASARLGLSFTINNFYTSPMRGVRAASASPLSPGPL